VASPDYLKKHGTPNNPEDLAGHNCIVGYKGSNVPDHKWPLTDGGFVQVSGTLMTNHLGLRMQAARMHLGIALVIDGEAQPHLESGDLVQVLPDKVGREDKARLVYPDREFLPPKVRAFVDFIAGQVEARRGKS
jgi:DNA-binding transcriptional LysR family regulator